MEITHRQRHGFRLPAILSAKQVVLCALIIDLLSAALFAQSLQYPLQDNAGLRLPATPNDRVVVDKGDAPLGANKEKRCSIKPFPGMPSIASVTSLQIPHKGSKRI